MIFSIFWGEEFSHFSSQFDIKYIENENVIFETENRYPTQAISYNMKKAFAPGDNLFGNLVFPRSASKARISFCDIQIGNF